MKGIIYKYTSPSGKSYIGQTVREKVRMQRHKRAALNGSLCTFHKAIRKYGFENFKYEVLFTIDNDDKIRVKQKLNFMERYYIRKYDSYNNGYNMTLGGDGGSGTKHIEEYKQMMSERMKKNNPSYNMTDEWKQHIGDAQRGKAKSDEFKRLQSERMKKNNPMKNPESVQKSRDAKIGKHLSEEHKQKISSSNKGVIRSDVFKKRHSIIAQNRPRDSKGHFIKI